MRNYGNKGLVVGERCLLLTVDDYRSPAAKRRKAHSVFVMVMMMMMMMLMVMTMTMAMMTMTMAVMTMTMAMMTITMAMMAIGHPPKRKACHDGNAALWQNTGQCQCQLISLTEWGDKYLD